MNQATERARPGRKRSETSRLAILVAALELVGQVGYDRLTIERIATRAGVGKQTIYRWWPSKADVLLEAGVTKAELHVSVSDEGSYAADLRAFLDASYSLVNHEELAAVLRSLMAEAQIDRDFGERFRVAFLERRRDALGVVLDRARGRGDFPAQPSPGTVADIVFGTIWYRVLATHKRLDPPLIDELFAMLAGP